MTRVVDSSFLIAALDETDPRQDQARKLMADPTPILVPPEVVGETVGVVQARYDYGNARRVWEGLGRLDNLVHLNTTHVEDVAPVWFDAEGDLSWTDAAVVAHCLAQDAEPLYFDEAIEQAFLDQAG